METHLCIHFRHFSAVCNTDMCSEKRCTWVTNTGSVEIAYHDTEWGVPVHDDRHLFEMLILEGAQAGLSWTTILNKRATYQAAYDGFDVQAIARYDEAKRQALLQGPGVVRNRLKVAASIGNAQATLDLLESGSTLNEFLWDFVDGEPIQNQWRAQEEVPVSTAQSDAMSKALKQRGFKFVGTTICYAFMQGVGMVNDHLVSCFRHEQVKRL